MIPRYQASCCLLPLLLWGTAAPAGNNFTLDPERVGTQNLEEPIERKEGPVGLPPWPRDADLIAFVPDGPPTGLRYFIDGKNLRLDESGAIVRYTLVIESANGTRNLSYEGIHCTLKGAYKTYAYGAEGRFIPAPAADWQPIARDGVDASRDDLRANRFCVPRETRLRPQKDILRALHGQGSAKDNTGFQAN